MPTNTAKPCVPCSCWLSTRLHCSTPDIFVHRHRVVLGKETVPLSAANTYISSHIRKRVCTVQYLLNDSTAASSSRICLVFYRFIDLFYLLFRVDSINKRPETLIISTTNHEHSDFFKKSWSPRYRLKFNAKELLTRQAI